MRLDYDQNQCCTAIVLHQFYHEASIDAYDRVLEGLGKKEDRWQGYNNKTYEKFCLALAVLEEDFVSHIQRLPTTLRRAADRDTAFRNLWGQYEVSQLSLIFCMTSTGEASSEQDEEEEYLREFGFIPTQPFSSKKYRGESIVTMWSMPAEEFSIKCKDYLKDWKDVRRAAIEASKSPAKKKKSTVEGKGAVEPAEPVAA